MKTRYKVKPRNTSLILILVIFATNLSAGFNNIKFDHLSKNEGLPHSYVKAILQDRQGFMWFGTEAGLAKYDGYKFTLFEHTSNDTNSISANDVTALFEDKQGNIWIGTNGGGLNVYDPVQEKFKSYQYNPENSNSIGSNVILSLLEDSKGILWIGTEGGGLNKIDYEKEKFTRLNLNEDNAIVSLYEDDEGTLWIGTWEGLFQIDQNSDEIVQHKIDPNGIDSDDNYIAAITKDKQGNLWVGTEGSGIYTFEKNKNVFSLLKVNLDKNLDWRKEGIVSLLTDNDGGIWIGTWDGLIQFDPKNITYNFYNHENMDPFSLSDGSIITMYLDRSGIIWIGTADGGISKYDQRKNMFHHVYSVPGKSGSLNTKLVSSIFTQKSGVVWIGTTFGLNRFDPINNKNQIFFPIENDPTSISAWNVKVIFADTKGNLWIGTDGAGINRWNEKTKNFKRYSPQPNNLRYLNNGDISSLIEDDFGQLWIATQDYGLNIYNPKTELFKYIQNDSDDPNSLSSDKINSLYKDRNGIIWIGTGDAGLDKYDAEKDVFIHYVHKENINSLKGNSVYTLHDDNDGNLWIGTEYGLNKFQISKDTFKLISKDDGLSGNIIYGILEDNSGNLWLSTNDGLSKYNPKSESIRNYDISDGLQSNEFRFGAYHKSFNGEMYFGGVNGYNRFFPEKIIENTFIPNIVLTNFKVFGKNITFDSALVNTDEIELSYKDNFFTFEFAALDYFAPERNKYAFKLEGVDEDWKYVNNLRFASYTKIDPGNYEFNVKGSNNHGLWNEEGVSIKIIITPPYWQTLWFRYLAGVIILLSAFLLYRKRIENVLKRNKKLELEVEKRTSELVIKNEQIMAANENKDQLLEEVQQQRDYLQSILRELEITQLELTSANEKLVQSNIFKRDFIANMSHEIRTPMNGIIGLNQLLLETNLNDDQIDLVESVQHSSELLKSIINDILDLSKIEAGKLDLEIIEFNILELIYSITDMMAFKAIEKNLEFIIDIDPQLFPLVQGDPIRIQQILINLVGNAIKFTSKGEIILKIQVSEKDLKTNHLDIKFSVADSGIGIPKERRKSIFESFAQAETSTTRKYGGTGLGLTISKQLVELMSGTIGVDSEVDQGSTFWFTVKLAAKKMRDKSRSIPPELKEQLKKSEIHIIDKNSESGEHLKKQLQHIGAQPKYSSKLKINIHLSSSQNNHIKVLFIDSSVINLNDKKSTSQIRNLAAEQNIVFVILTKINQQISNDNLTDLNIQHTIMKPIKPGKLTNTLHRIFNIDLLTTFSSEEDDIEPTDMDSLLEDMRVLIVEDNLINQKLIQRLLEKKNINPTIASDGYEAIEKIESTTFDLVLMDIQMPGMNGFEVAEAIRKMDCPTCRKIPIIALTANAMKGDREKCLDAGMNDYLTKPIDLKKLYSSILKYAPERVEV